MQLVKWRISEGGGGAPNMDHRWKPDNVAPEHRERGDDSKQT